MKQLQAALGQDLANLDTVTHPGQALKRIRTGLAHPPAGLDDCGPLWRPGHQEVRGHQAEFRTVQECRGGVRTNPNVRGLWPQGGRGTQAMALERGLDAELD